MPEFLRDPLWQFIGAVVGVVAIVATIVVFFLQRKRKALSFEIVTSTSLLSVKDEVKGRVQILLDGTPITNAHMVVMRVVNTGNVPIVPSDYVRPVTVDFGEMATILSAEIMETNPDNVNASVETDHGAVVVLPALLNSGDSITVKVLLTQYVREVDVDCRIVGVKSIQPIRESWFPRVGMPIGVLMFAAGIVLVTDSRVMEPGAVVLMCAGYLLMVVAAAPAILKTVRRWARLLSHRDR